MSNVYNSRETQALVTPTRSVNNPKRRRLSTRAIAEPYERRNSQLGSPNTSPRRSPRNNCSVSTGSSALAHRPSPVSATTSIVPEAEPPDARTPSRRSQLSDSSPSTPIASSPEEDNTITTLSRLRYGLRTNSSSPAQVSPVKIDKRIEDSIRKPLSATQSRSETLGNNYLFAVVTRNSAGEQVMKIGSTTGPTQLRRNTIDRVCDHVSVEHQDDPKHMPIRLYKRAEMLMHKELEDFKHSFQCQCIVNAHREYFHVEKSVALEVMQRWREFCKREPYDNTGKLRPFWEHRLNHFRVTHSPEAMLDHQARARRWRAFMNPPRFSVFWYDLIQSCNRLWRWRWPAISLIQSFMLAILFLPRVYPVVVFGLMVVWVLVEMSDLDRPLFPSALLWALDGHQSPSSDLISSATDTAAEVVQIDEDYNLPLDDSELEDDKQGND